MSPEVQLKKKPGHHLSAGPFSPWLRQMRRALQGRTNMDVPCGACRACCTSFQFVHVGGRERAAVRAIPRRLRIPAPEHSGRGWIMGYFDNGHCPMLKDKECAVYLHRPKTCRVYDCRLFAAAGCVIEDPRRRRIRDQAARWVFECPTARDRRQLAAVREGFQFLREQGHRLPEAVRPHSPEQAAILAVKVYRVFMRSGTVPARRLHAVERAWKRFTAQDILRA